jgi:hypothetical protein
MVWHKTIGNGPTKVIVIHGWFWDHRVFTPIFDCLDTASHTYAFVDIRGYGNSHNVSGEYSIGEVAAIALADQLGWREFHVVGHSMGGKAAQKIQREDQLTMETKLEQIAVKTVNQLPKSVVREIRTPRSVGTGGGRPPPATRWEGEEKSSSLRDHRCLE